MNIFASAFAAAFGNAKEARLFRAVRSVFSDEKKLSIAALSQTLPDRLEFAVEHVRSDGGDLPLTQIGRQSPLTRAGFESL